MFTHDKTLRASAWQNQQNDCLPSEESVQHVHLPSLINLHCPHEESLGPKLPIERTAKTDAQPDLSLGWVHSQIVGFVMLRLICDS